MKLEVHVHTRYSKDSLLSLSILYFRCRIKNIKWIAITEHNNIDGGIAFKKYCEKRGNKVNVIIGEEIFTNAGEIIGLYLKEKIPPQMSVEDTIRAIKSQNGVVYVPHPFDEKRKKTVLKYEEIEKNKEQIDCIEIHNGRNVKKDYSIKQEKIAENNNLLAVVGSDAHTWIEIGRNYLIVDHAPVNSIEFVNAIQDATLIKKECILLAHKITKIAKGLKLVRKGKFDELCRIVITRIKRDKY